MEIILKAGIFKIDPINEIEFDDKSQLLLIIPGIDGLARRRCGRLGGRRDARSVLCRARVESTLLFNSFAERSGVAAFFFAHGFPFSLALGGPTASRGVFLIDGRFRNSMASLSRDLAM